MPAAIIIRSSYVIPGIILIYCGLMVDQYMEIKFLSAFLNSRPLCSGDLVRSPEKKNPRMSTTAEPRQRRVGRRRRLV